jgi:predicted transcriptional regulator
MRAAKVKPSELELQVLSVLWGRGPSTARQVLDALADGKARAYTTVLTVLQVMEKKGLLTHTRDGVTHVYKPALSRRQVVGPLLRGLVERVFGGSTSAAVQHLLDDTDVTADDVERIRGMLREHERGKNGSTSGGKSK